MGSEKAAQTARMGRKGTLVLPAALRRRFGLKEGSPLVVEERAEGILLRPAVTVPVETYSPERVAEFLLNTAVNLEDYEAAREEVRKLGLDPDAIPHDKPTA